MKRAVCLLILLSMVMHCASRLGVLSYLYSKRHDIAYRVGLIAQVPIAMCNGDYFTKQAPLVIDDLDHADQQIPAPFPQAKEIFLFLQPTTNLVATDVPEIELNHYTAFQEGHYIPPSLSIFHPPCQG